jgi:hypothetical protein
MGAAAKAAPAFFEGEGCTMRKLMWFTLGFAAACALCAYFWLTESIWLYAVGFGMLAVPAIWFMGRVK